MRILIAWQLWLLYLFLAAVIVHTRIGSRKWRKTRLAVLTLLALCAAAVWLILPFPMPPQPAGPYAVGTQIFRWVDPSRPETATPDLNDRRNVIAQIFYPAPPASTGEHSPYLDGLRDLPQEMLLPRWLFTNAGFTNTHSILDAPVSPDRPRWPVIVFSPGFGGPRGFYTTLITNLASRGFAVLAMDHPYEARVTELADGRIVGHLEPPHPNEGDTVAYMIEQQDIRAADIRFALDRIAQQPIAASLDLDRITAAGHSFGGAASFAVMKIDRRIRAAANVDGTPYGALPETRFDRPVMVISSSVSLKEGSDRFRTGNTKILEHAEAPAYRFTMPETHHYSYTDLPFFFSPPGRWLLNTAMGGPRNVDQIQQATADLLAAFATVPAADPAAVEHAAASHDWVTGGRVP